jgi:hypothetical protein
LLLPVEAVLAQEPGTARVRVLGREVTVRRGCALEAGPARLVVRPGQLRLDPTGEDLAIAAEVVDVVYLGDTTQVRCQAPDVRPILARVNPRDAADLQPGQQVRVGFFHPR